MRRILATGGAVVALSAIVAPAQAGVIDPVLDDLLERTPADASVTALVYLVDQADVSGITAQMDQARATLAQRHETVVRALQDIASFSQPALLAHLDAQVAAGHVDGYKPYWIANLVRVDGTPAAIRQIADRADVDIVYHNYGIELIEPVDTKLEAPAAQSGGPEPGINAVRAPEVWALGITGAGVLTSSLDTGVDGNHPALASRWRGLDSRYNGNPEWAWFDPVTNTSFPQGWGSHGTHTMGTICGGAPGDQVGVAPGAEWIHAATIDRVSIARTVADSLDAFEWLIDPDGNPSTNWDVPAVCSNSWGLLSAHGYPNCDQTFWQHLDNCEAAGIVILFSAGNEGNSGLRRPADRATDEYRTCAVAAVDGNNQNYPIAGFSSRGPTNCTPDGSAAIKPDISAPGVSVRSSVIGGGYSNLSGTSMASPHINGVVCLMREANPNLAVDEIKQIIYDTALDLGANGEDNSYGYGMVDAFEAVTEALARSTLALQLPNGLPEFIDPSGGQRIRVLVVAQQEEQEPGSGMLHYTTGGPFTSIPMEVVDDDEYDAVFPSFDCGDVVSYYFSVETQGGETVTSPFNAPDSTYSGEAYDGVNIAFQDDFETDMGWTVQNSQGLTTGQWERGNPPGGDRGDPPSDWDGSGQCYVTGLASGDNDIDDGSTVLTSPDMDGTDPEAVLSYARWYSNTFGADPENDIFVIEVSDDGGATWHPLETVGPAGQEVNGGWFHKQWLIADIPNIDNTDQIRVRFNASDLNDGSVVEAGVDAVEISLLFCDDAIPGDVDGDGDVDFGDILALLAAWGPVDDCPPYIPADQDQDCDVDFQDLLVVLSEWTG